MNDQKAREPREIYLDRWLLDAAMDSLDLGESKMIRMYMYPHKDTVPDVIKFVEKSYTDQILKERDDFIERYKLIELANSVMSRNDHVHFGELIQERDAALAVVERLKAKLDKPQIKCEDCGAMLARF
jgi:hypothetical protein